MGFSEWKEVKLGEVANVLSGYGFKSKDFRDYGIPVIKIKNIVPPYVTLDEVQYVSQELSDERNRYKIKYGDILISLTGSNVNQFASAVGKVGRVKINKEMLLNQRVGKFEILDENIYNLDFLYYSISTEDMHYKLAINAGGAANQANISPSLIKSMDLPCPSICEQKAIVAILSPLDDKIELNNLIIKTLEEIEQTIFKSWFIDFEPFKDKKFEDSDIGSIPEGWRIGTLGELISDTLSGDWGKEMSQGNFTEEVTCIRGADIPEIASGKKGKPATRFILKKNLEKKQLSAGQIIIEISGGSPTQSTGRTALITEELVTRSVKPLICTNFCRALSLKKNSYSTFLYSMLQYLYKINLFFQYENGTTGIKNLDTNNLFNKYQIIIPTDEIMVEYEAVFSTLIKSIYKNGSQSDKLLVIRNTILPKLMRGEIRVPMEGVEMNG
ncbi:restriction endonuclease subunit S [Clostridium sp.]|uniref:restriction endonuclease subunit S n=1 Tax=Clostridium sp. TaxID=1506 RepID=UPI00262E1EF8|nr:restriction endonuclease subunit S [uncultured Clostridium sp.]